MGRDYYFNGDKLTSTEGIIEPSSINGLQYPKMINGYRFGGWFKDTTFSVKSDLNDEDKYGYIYAPSTINIRGREITTVNTANSINNRYVLMTNSVEQGFNRALNAVRVDNMFTTSEHYYHSLLDSRLNSNGSYDFLLDWNVYVYPINHIYLDIPSSFDTDKILDIRFSNINFSNPHNSRIFYIHINSNTNSDFSGLNVRYIYDNSNIGDSKKLYPLGYLKLEVNEKGSIPNVWDVSNPVSQDDFRRMGGTSHINVPVPIYLGNFENGIRSFTVPADTIYGRPRCLVIKLGDDLHEELYDNMDMTYDIGDLDTENNRYPIDLKFNKIDTGIISTNFNVVGGNESVVLNLNITVMSY